MNCYHISAAVSIMDIQTCLLHIFTRYWQNKMRLAPQHAFSLHCPTIHEETDECHVIKKKAQKEIKVICKNNTSTLTRLIKKLPGVQQYKIHYKREKLDVSHSLALNESFLSFFGNSHCTTLHCTQLMHKPGNSILHMCHIYECVIIKTAHRPLKLVFD